MMATEPEQHPPTELEIFLKYDGPALADGRMHARDLAPAIFGMADAIDRANTILNRGRGRVHVEVNANFRRASFGIEFFAVSTPGELVSLSAEDLKLIAQFLLLGVPAVGSLIMWIRRQAGRPVDRIERQGDTYNIHIEGDVISLEERQFQLFRDVRLRESLESVMEPLDRPGVDELAIGEDPQEQPQVVIQKAERPYFSKNLAPAEELGTERGVQWLDLVAPNFKEGNKWRFAKGEDAFFAEILDRGFLARVQRGEIEFAAGDRFRVVLQERATASGERTHFDRAIIHVISHWTTGAGGEVVVKNKFGFGPEGPPADFREEEEALREGEDI